MIIGLCMLILGVLSLLSVVSGNSFVGILDTIGIDNTAIVDGSPSTFIIESQQIVFGIDALTGGLVLLVGIGSATILVGFNIVGSGLNDTAVKTATILIIYGAIWGVLSILAYPLIVQIALYGALIYITITLIYAYGVIKKISEG